ncbi:MAG: class I SAM-dependent methyltransferase [Acidobacteria bacterium]|nr:class I SAM-dependent methyltransferase [Acidobacteriota bacterium]
MRPNKRTVSPEDLKRLYAERKAADRAYNEALTALADALQQLRDLPHPPPSYDDGQVAALHALSDPLGDAPPAGAGWRGRLRARVRGTVAPMFERQKAFNATLLEHIDRNAATHRELPRALASTIELIREEHERLIRFQSRLVQFAEEITPYVDTKDREVDGLMRRINEDNTEFAADLAKRVLPRLDRLSDEIDAWQHVIAALKRDMAALSARTAAPVPPDGAGEPAPPAGTASAPSAPPPAAVVRATEDESYRYVAFENRFRGSLDEIRTRVADYLPYFEGASDVLDVGCGRGEFLDLLRERGIRASGVDINQDMVELCRARGLEVVQGDALDHLERLDDGALGGLFAAQVVEHLEPSRLVAFIDAAHRKLRPGAPLALETINVASWSAFFRSYIRDLTHARPVHPETLQFLVSTAGFRKARIIYRSPYPEEERLRQVEDLPAVAPTDGGGDPPASASGGAGDPAAGLVRLATVLNRNVETLNRLLFAEQDYAVVAERA